MEEEMLAMILLFRKSHILFRLSTVQDELGIVGAFVVRSHDAREVGIWSGIRTFNNKGILGDARPKLCSFVIEKVVGDRQKHVF